MPHTAVADIVAQGSFLGQTAASTTFTLFVPTQSGTFRVTSAPNVTSGPGGITQNAPIWTDSSGSRTVNITTGSASFFALGGNPIQVLINAGTPITYDLHWSVEHLG